MSNSEDIVLFWYPYSPFAQKIGWILNYKKVEYKTVLIDVMEPRPKRRPFDGGYRKTPVLQVGQHTFCDTKTIIAEIEKLFPEPSLYPKTSNGNSSESLCRGLNLWLDNTVFNSAVTQLPIKTLPENFVADRSAMLGRPLDAEKIAAAAPFLKTEVAAQFHVLEQILGQKKWLLDTELPSSVDFSSAMMVFFLVNLIGEEWVKNNLKVMFEHMNKVLAISNWDQIEKRPSLTEDEAIEGLKRYATAEVPEEFKVHSSVLPIQLGQQVVVMPLDTGKVPIIGTLVRSTVDETVILYKDPTYETTSVIHFPTLGFIVMPKTD
ncbi:hypothetical protein A0J61_00874 [Choanephora cucurbitarum]|uniref:GST N-terminal domain-containing protein n=1 Tax=Choanephora cucurbitarum TaxID=101091 RepID=A0A1C7NPM0_9FUNG|nr:hypothetical protein A0J61_00874 [Choanephora cucurbitarum]